MLGAMWVDALALGALGLLVGSFLNVVIYRLPKMMERQWQVECAEYSGTPVTKEPAFNLMVPRSRCRHCGHEIRWHENIPVLSYVLLGGKCSSCRTSISLRYPAVELTTAALFAVVGWRFGMTLSGACWAVFVAGLLTLALIDWDTTFLPDDITLPLLWLGMGAAALGWITTPLVSSFWGAAAGYLSLWAIYWSFKLLTHKEGMGYGDFKLFAALGAWLGWQALIPLILLASSVGAVAGIGMKMSASLREGHYVPFGPFLALGGLTMLAVGPSHIARFLHL